LHCLLFAICLADRQQERATYCAHTAWQPSGLHFGFELNKSLNKRHDLYLIASLWVVATQVRASLTIFELSSVTSRLQGFLPQLDEFYFQGLSNPKSCTSPQLGWLPEPHTHGRGFRDFYHNWTNSISQQLKSDFCCPYTLVPCPQNFSKL
jgi:hypothetical protein